MRCSVCLPPCRRRRRLTSTTRTSCTGCTGSSMLTSPSILHGQHGASVSRDQIGQSQICLPYHRWTALMLRITIQYSLNMLESGSGKRAHIEPKSQKVGVEQRCHQRVPEQKRSKQNSCKDSHFGISYEPHSRIVVRLNPSLDEFGDFGRWTGGLGCSCTSSSCLVGSGCG